jgi:ABC-2 type transport system ATP-binding protein
MKSAISVDNLRKVYGPVVAVDGISFEVHEEEIFGMVGPNGAGKTTTIECIEGLRRPDEGSVQVLGLHPQRDGYELRERIGVQLQEAALPYRIKVWEALDLFASFYSRQVDWHPLLEVFLDELTTGLDPQARRAMWDLVRSIRERGKTVFLTTHYMEEAEQLCDRVAVIDQGQIVALDTPENLIRSLGAENRVVFSVDDRFDEEPLRAAPGVTRVERIGERVVVYGQGDRLVGGVVNALEAGGARFHDLRTEQPSLEDVFLALTGREMRE